MRHIARAGLTAFLALLLLAAVVFLAVGGASAASTYYWTQQTSGTTQSLTAGDGFNSTHAWAGGGNSTILFCDGSNWTSQTNPGQSMTPMPFIGGISAPDATHVWAAGDNLNIMFSDGSAGGNWVSQSGTTTAADPDFFACDALSTTSAWAVGSGGTIYTTSNGTTWTNDNVAGGIADGLRSVSALDADHVWAAGYDGSNNGHIYFRGAGHTWNTTPQHTVSGIQLRSVLALSATNVWAVGNGGIILHYDGTNWTEHAQSRSVTTQALYMIKAADANHMWVAGSADTILFYDGATFSAQTTGVTAANHRAVEVGDANNVWISGQSGRIFYGTPPRISDVSPTTAGQGKTLDVNITGSNTHFVNGTSVVSFSGTGITINSSSVSNATHATANITVAPGAALGARDVNVVTGAETPDVGTITVVDTPIHIIDASAGANGSIDPTGQVIVNEGNNQAFNINPATYYEVADVKVDDVSVGVVTSYTFNSVDQDHTISAIFSNVTYTINASAGANGSIDPSGDVTVNGGADKTFDFYPDLNYHVDEVLVDGSPVTLGSAGGPDKLANAAPAASYTFRGVTANHTIAVSFAVDTFDVNASVLGGHGTVNPSSQSVDYDGTATINIAPSAYHHLASITDNGAAQSVTNPYVINNLKETHAVVVTFAPTPPDVQSVDPPDGKPGTRVAIGGKDFGKSQGGSTVTVGGVQAEVVSWSDTRIVVTVPEGASSGAIVVSTPGGSNGRAFAVYFPTWYLAEGSTAWGFGTTINILNPNTSEVTARMTYLDIQAPAGKGIAKIRDVKLPALSRTSINAVDDLGFAIDFSTKVDCLEGKTIAVDRTMTWSSGMGKAIGSHNSVGVTLPAKTWYLPEGSSAWGFECWTLVENPNKTEANVTLTYMIEGVGPKSFAKVVPAYSRATFKMADDIGAADASIGVTSDVPVIPERSMYQYWTSPETGTQVRREGHDSAGTTAPATDYYLAEGSTAWGFTTYVLVQNPNKAEAKVTVTYNTSSGPITMDPLTMPAQSRKTIRVNDVMPDQDLSTHVHADVPIIAERSMYWATDASTGQAMHDSIGISAAHLTWYLPDGLVTEEDGGAETYTLVQNPNDFDMDIRVSYLKPGGTDNVVFTDTVKANSRMTYKMADKLEDTEAAVMVECIPPRPAMSAALSGIGVIVERSIYYGGRWSGTDTIGAFDDTMTL